MTVNKSSQTKWIKASQTYSLPFSRDAEVAERQAAVPLDLGEARRQVEHSQGWPWKLDPRVSLEVWDCPEVWQSRKAFWKRRETKRPFI